MWTTHRCVTVCLTKINLLKTVYPFLYTRIKRWDPPRLYSLNRVKIQRETYRQVWRNWQTRMVQFAPPRCKFISLTISCKLWIKHLAPPRFSPLNRVKIQREKLNMHPWRNWQTRMVQVHIFERKCRFNSCRVHHWPCNPSQFTRSFLFFIINALISFVRFQNSFE